VTTEDIIVHIFCYVDDALGVVPKEPLAKLHPSEVVTIGILFALKGGHFHAFYRWLKRDYDGLFGGLPERTRLLRQLQRHEDLTDHLLCEPSLLCVADSYPIELIFPIRQGRSAQQVGGKGKDKGRWSVGVKLAWVVNTFGDVCGWSWQPMNQPDQDFLPLLAMFDQESVVMTDFGFRCAAGIPTNVKICKKGTWNERIAIETIFSLMTVICKAKKIHHRAAAYIQARLAYMAATFNVCLALFHTLHDADPFKISIAEFSL